jgi:carboxymethylenebutenolidase
MKGCGLVIAAAALALAGVGGPALAQEQGIHAHHVAVMDAAVYLDGQVPFAAALTKQPHLPPSQQTAKATLDASKRRREYVEIPAGKMTWGHPGNELNIRTYVVYPDKVSYAPIVIVFSNNQGLSDWAKALGEQVASEGFIAVVPDMVSGLGPNMGNTESFANSPMSVAAFLDMMPPSEEVMRINAVYAYAMRLPGANGKSGAIGFCWGGRLSFDLAVEQPGLSAAVNYYGNPPRADFLELVQAPILGLYGGNDARINVTIEPTATAMKKLGKSFESHIFPGAGHGFVEGQSRSEADYRAMEQSWPMAMAFLKKHTM